MRFARRNSSCHGETLDAEEHDEDGDAADGDGAAHQGATWEIDSAGETHVRPSRAKLNGARVYFLTGVVTWTFNESITTAVVSGDIIGNDDDRIK